MTIKRPHHPLHVQKGKVLDNEMGWIRVKFTASNLSAKAKKAFIHDKNKIMRFEPKYLTLNKKGVRKTPRGRFSVTIEPAPADSSPKSWFVSAHNSKAIHLFDTKNEAVKWARAENSKGKLLHVHVNWAWKSDLKKGFRSITSDTTRIKDHRKNKTNPGSGRKIQYMAKIEKDTEIGYLRKSKKGITHFQAYSGPAFEVASNAAADWFLKHLK